MCGRFYVPADDEDESMVRILAGADARAERLHQPPVARGEVFPTQTVAALALSRHGETQAFPFYWGYRLGGGRPLINIRSESAAERPLFRDSMARRRCLIPAAYYYEWERTAEGGKTKLRHELRSQTPGPVWLAGLYRFEPGQTLPVLAILTRAAAPEIAYIHSRMPVICPPDALATWLDPAADPREITERPQPMTVVL